MTRKSLLSAILPRVVSGLALVAFFAGCGMPPSSVVPTPSNSACANVSYVGEVATNPSSITYNLETTSAAGAQSKVTITRGVAPFEVSSSSFVGLGKTGSTSTLTDGTGQPILGIYLDETDAVSSAVDPSCTTYVFYLQPIGPFNPANTYTEYVTVRDSTSSSFNMEVKVISKVPLAKPTQ